MLYNVHVCRCMHAYVYASPVCWLYALTPVFQLFNDSDMMDQTRRRKPETTVLPTQGFFNCSHYIGMVWQKLAFDDTISYTQ